MKENQNKFFRRIDRYVTRRMNERIPDDVQVDMMADELRLVSAKLAEAKRLLRGVLAREHHDELCEVRRFRRANRFLPATHPAWKSAPACSCPLAEIEKFLKD